MKPVQINSVTRVGHQAGSGDFDLATHNGHYVTVTDLAHYWKVSVDTVYRDIKKGALRAYRVGSSGKIRVHVDDARQYGRPAD
jgi:excisionase family DNA binding protein